MSLCPLYPQGNNAPNPMTECVTAGSWQTDTGIGQSKLTDGNLFGHGPRVDNESNLM